MAGIILDGKALSKQIEQELAGRVQRIRQRSSGATPISRPSWSATIPRRRPTSR